MIESYWFLFVLALLLLFLIAKVELILSRLGRLEVTLDGLCRSFGLSDTDGQVIEKLLRSEKVRALTMSWTKQLFADGSLIRLLPDSPREAAELVRKKTGMTKIQAQVLIQEMITQLMSS